MLYLKKDLQFLEMITTNGGKVSFEIKKNHFMENVLHNWLKLIPFPFFCRNRIGPTFLFYTGSFLQGICAIAFGFLAFTGNQEIFLSMSYVLRWVRCLINIHIISYQKARKYHSKLHLWNQTVIEETYIWNRKIFFFPTDFSVAYVMPLLGEQFCLSWWPSTRERRPQSWLEPKWFRDWVSWSVRFIL